VMCVGCVDFTNLIMFVASVVCFNVMKLDGNAQLEIATYQV